MYSAIALNLITCERIFLSVTNLYYNIQDMWCVVVLVLSLQPRVLYDTIRVLLRLLRRELELEVVRKYIPREA
jgi:hypothetical protein